MARVRFGCLLVLAIVLLALLQWTPAMIGAKSDKKAKTAQDIPAATEKSKKSSDAFTLHLSNVVVEVTSQSAGETQPTVLRREELNYPTPWAEPLTVEPGNHLLVTLQLNRDTASGKGVRAHQAFVVLEPVRSGEEPVAPLGPLVQVLQSTSSGRHRIQLIANRFKKYFSRQPGTYTLTLLLGTFGDASAIRYPLGQLNVDFPTMDPTDPAVVDEEDRRAKQRALEGPSNAEFLVRPEIVHQYRAPEKRAPVAFSILYSAGVLAPWIVLLGLWKAIGVSLDNLPKSSSAAIQHMLFLGCIAAFLGLYVLYWLQLKLLTTITYAAVLLVPTVLTGRSALSDVARRRVKATKKE